MVSTILLSSDDTYVKDGRLPIGRPDWDKELLTALCKGAFISSEAEKMLPKSISSKTITVSSLVSIGITIPEIDRLAKVLIVVRAGIASNGGKKFRFTNFKNIMKSEQIEIWEKHDRT